MRVLVTRAAEDAGSLVAGLRALGLDPVCVPLIHKEPGAERVARAAESGHDGWVLTSPAAVASLALTRARPRWIAAVGPATARAAERAGLRVDRVPPRALGRSLALALGDLQGQRVFYPHADLAPPDLADALREAGATVDAVIAYRNREPQGAAAALASALPVDWILLLSGSAARRLAAHLPGPLPAPTRVVAIGPSTAAEAERVGLPVHAIADPHTVDGLLAAVAALRGGRP